MPSAVKYYCRIAAVRFNYMFEKIIVIGCPGAGKSTFSRKLRDLTDLPLYYLDMLWHKPDKTNYTAEEFDSKLKQILSGEKWIIDGNYSRTLKMRLDVCDTVFFLDYPLDVCLSGVESRIGKKREDMPWIEEEFDEEFRQWIIDFKDKNIPYLYDSLQNLSDKEIHIFKSRDEADTFLRNFKQIQ